MEQGRGGGVGISIAIGIVSGRGRDRDRRGGGGGGGGGGEIGHQICTNGGAAEGVCRFDRTGKSSGGVEGELSAFALDSYPIHLLGLQEHSERHAARVGPR